MYDIYDVAFDNQSPIFPSLEYSETLGIRIDTADMALEGTYTIKVIGYLTRSNWIGSNCEEWGFARVFHFDFELLVRI